MFVDTPKNGSKLLFYYVCSFVILSCLNKSHGNFRDFKRVFSYNWKVKPKEKNLIICSIESIYIYILLGQTPNKKKFTWVNSKFKNSKL